MLSLPHFNLFHAFIDHVSAMFQSDYTVETGRQAENSGTSIKLGGDFALSLGGSRTQYLPSDASARDVKLALEALDTVGTVDVERNDGDEEVRQDLNPLLLELILLRNASHPSAIGVSIYSNDGARLYIFPKASRCSARTVASRLGPGPSGDLDDECFGGRLRSFATLNVLYCSGGMQNGEHLLEGFRKANLTRGTKVPQ